jgi:hypothetical protein
MTTELENSELIYYMITNLFLTFYLVTAAYYIQKTKTTIKRAATCLNELFWAVNDTLEMYNGIEYADNDDITTPLFLEDVSTPPSPTIEIKYEDKYLKELEKLNPDFQFTWDMVRQRDERTVDLLKGFRIKTENDMKILNCKLNSLDNQKREEEEEKEEILELLRKMEYTLHNPNKEEMKQEAQLYVKNNYLDGFVNNFIMEKTPSGNVIMYYNHKRGSFEFYSDNTIPYRYLETVSRKYVKTFNCRYLYVDMDNELNEFDRLRKEENEKKGLALENVNVVQESSKKKDVFAKFKGYNKESGTGRVNTAVAPKNSVPNNVKKMLAEDDAIIRLKMNANRYTCEGRLSNFNFLKVPDRKVVDKKYAMSFADFKKKSTSTTTTLLI